ncbi:hypothetical protein [Mesoflavibacter sp. SCSIO 43206]|uniref:hypothetical protein n=1 Tax=Mesoflavibacter sp. SCSIO 43206 TaxID=2779362 RepID=UPI001CA879C9|nr:hypothetical protein [Mesoflavibacter sp. SCSIO 43206]UAB74374.1 hypothetical protein INR78_08185 [Mesoflavibacter sp. SCSIO 43206]
MKNFFSLIKDENILLKIKKKSQASFWEYQILGLFYYLFNLSFDYFIITEKKIVYVIKNKLIKIDEYSDFSTLEFNSKNDIFYYKNIDNQEQKLNLKRLRLSYEEIQKIKKVLNHNI